MRFFGNHRDDNLDHGNSQRAKFELDQYGENCGIYIQESRIDFSCLEFFNHNLFDVWTIFHVAS